MFGFTDYQTVLALLEDRHFHRASRRLNITQPALTARLQRIEEAIGTQLFERGRNGVRPTPAGIAFAEGARRVIEAADQAVENTRNASLGLGETLIVGITQIAAYAIVPQILKTFRYQQPQARIKLTEGTTAWLEARLESREIDIAFLHPPIHSSVLSEHLLSHGKLVRVNAGESKDPGYLIRYPRADAPVLMGQLGRQSDTAGELIYGEADTMLGAFILSKAGYGTCVIEQNYFETAFGASQENPHQKSSDKKSSHKKGGQKKNLSVEACGDLDTSIAWRASDKRSIINAFTQCAIEYGADLDFDAG